ncbi:MAG: 5-oxoprolinase subunit B family protein [Actinomycetota bacterium]
MKVRICGSAAVLVELADLPAVQRCAAVIRAQSLSGLIDVVPAARTILLTFDPTLLDHVTVSQMVQDAAGLSAASPASVLPVDSLSIPVQYNGPDVLAVAEFRGCAVKDVIAWHTGTPWVVAFNGFAPGFGYLIAENSGSADRAWSVPRRREPRVRVPAGSVAVAAQFTGVYPRASPGGWQLIGHTMAKVWDSQRDPPALLTPGVRVRFAEVA